MSAGIDDGRALLAVRDNGTGMDGMELARRLRQLPGPEQVRLAAMTGYGQARDRRASEEAGFDAHFVKPVETDALAAWLAEQSLIS